jgi:hypothetical protein
MVFGEINLMEVERIHNTKGLGLMILGGVSTLWIYDLTIFNKLFYDKALLAYRNNHIHIVETPPDFESGGKKVKMTA